MSQGSGIKRRRDNGTNGDSSHIKTKIRKLQNSALPIAASRDEILFAIKESSVLILSGDTGSGKSTQLPQYILQAPWHQKSKLIGITEPRRVAAVSLAHRVASELKCPLGAGRNARVGYNVRFNAKIGHANEMLFLTEGMLLVELMSDPGLCRYEVVIIDEVHERSVNVDLLLGFLRNLVSGVGPGAAKRQEKKLKPLKAVVMSATADVLALKDFFDKGFAEAEVVIDNKPEHNAAGSGQQQVESRVSVVTVPGRQFPVETFYLDAPAPNVVDAALNRIFEIHVYEAMPGDILVFMSGQEIIQTLLRYVEDYAQKIGPHLPKLMAIPLYGALPHEAQQRIFERAPPNTRKVIIATNIAETSITVPGVRFVIDGGKEKRKDFKPSLGLEALLAKQISKSSATQRKGRAGREAAGKCWRLYTKSTYDDDFEDATAPEILRCDLTDVILKMKCNGIQDVVNFPLLNAPSRRALEHALVTLLQLGALERAQGDITDLGRTLCRFPLTPPYARVLYAASQEDRDCVLPVIDIVSCFSAENTIFLSTDTEEAREEAAAARATLLRRSGDHITYLAVVQAYATENTDRKAWCKARLINHRAMQNVFNIRKQLRSQCKSLRLLTEDQIEAYDNGTTSTDFTSDAGQAPILKCFCLAFRQNTARLMPDRSYRSFQNNQTLAIHPSSVLFGKKVVAILYNEFLFTTKAYASGVSAVELSWLDEVFS